ncbi:MAG: hypothetical protein CG439_188 [Methylococcaceae bacterium NSP1-2]|nr:MAG: hypothetical protein CG439_188 [Methylococcaceae bacterium NSP1-2]
MLILIICVLYIVWAIYRNQPTIIINKSPVDYFDEKQLIVFKERDPNFSRIVFLDFVHLLYVKYYSYYGKKDFDYLTPYLSDTVQHDKTLDLLIGQQVIIISEIVINSVRLFSITRTADEDRIGVEIESNYTVHPAFHTEASGKQHTRYARSERWFFQRKKSLQSLPPEKMQALSCPSCGAAAHFTDAGECKSCKTVIIKGQQQWYVKDRVVLNQSVLNSGDLVAYAEEQGTNLPTLSSPTLLQEIAAFEKQRTIVWSDYWNTFKQQIVQPYFLELNAAWTNHNLTKVRHLISDRLYDANSFWMELYSHYRFNNRLDDLKIQDIQLVKIELDKYYETITVRVFASCFDYTEDSNKKIIAGSNKKRRAYSEYWTFARRAGVEQNETGFDLNSCPQCGAHADKMGQSAICEYCGSKISTGQFSWVLFLITQDENYRG